MIPTLKLLLPIYLVIFIGIAFFWRSFMVWKKTGINPYALGNKDTAYDYIGRLLRLTLLASVLIVLAFSFSETVYGLLVPIPWLNHPVLIFIGLGLMAMALIWILLAQAQMGDSWRIGIDAQNRTELVQCGIFGISRNPIFLGMKFLLLGLLLTLPTAAALAVFILGLALIDIQVRLEEDHLLRLHGDIYRSYQQKVRRWL